MRQIHLYFEVNPNAGENVHYLTSRPARYMEELAPYLVADVDVDKYALNNGVLKIKSTAEPYEDITYIIEEEHDGARYDFFRCYRVKSFSIVGGFAVFSLDVDKWASSFNSAVELKDFHITRCNKLVYDEDDELQKGIFDAVPLTIGGQGLAPFQIAGRSRYPDTDFSIIAVCDVVTARNASGSIESTQRELFIRNISYFRSLFTAQETKGATPLEIASRCVASIAKITTSTIYHDNDVNVLKAYVVPSSFVPVLGDLFSYDLKGFSPYGGQEMTYTLYNVVPKIVKNSFNVNAVDIPLHYLPFFGVYNAGLPLKRDTSLSWLITYVTSVSLSGVSVFIDFQGERMDVSNYFELPLTGNAKLLDNSQKSAEALGYIANALGVIEKGFKTAFNPSASLGVAQAVARTAGGIMGASVQPDNINATGNAFDTFGYNMPTPYFGVQLTEVSSPYVVIFRESIRSEFNNALYNGVSYDAYGVDIYTLEQRPPVTDVYQHYDDVTTYVKGEIIATGTGRDYCDFIESEIARGINIKTL